MSGNVEHTAPMAHTRFGISGRVKMLRIPSAAIACEIRDAKKDSFPSF
jgi:hypothetical protein